MGKALLILSALVGYSAAVKIYVMLKMSKSDVEIIKMNREDFEELIKDPKYKKYMR